jgi:hypothetical protein
MKPPRYVPTPMRRRYLVNCMPACAIAIAQRAPRRVDVGGDDEAGSGMEEELTN